MERMMERIAGSKNVICVNGLSRFYDRNFGDGSVRAITFFQCHFPSEMYASHRCKIMVR